MQAPSKPERTYTDPLLADPLQQCGRIIVTPPRSYPGADGVPVKIAGNNPMRMALTVLTSSLDYLYVHPFPVTVGVFPVAAAILYTPIVIHAAAYPGLIQGEWWAHARAGQTIFVYESSLER